MANGYHTQHRERLKRRFLKEGLEKFEAHNILELLLFFAIPQSDTNELAHRLLQRFGSVTEVFNASYEELLSVNGVKENAATLIKMIPELSRVYREEKTDFEKNPDYGSLGAFFVSRFTGLQYELVMAAFFSAEMEYLGAETLYTGNLNSSAMPLKKLLEISLSKNAAYVVLAHNHPDSCAMASAEDLNTTDRLKKYLSELDVVLLDHFIVAQGTFGSLNREQCTAYLKKATASDSP